MQKNKIVKTIFIIFLLITVILPVFNINLLPKIKASPISEGEVFQDWFDYEYIISGSAPKGQGTQNGKWMEFGVQTGTWTSDMYISSENPINGTDSLFMTINGSSCPNYLFGWTTIWDSPDPYSLTQPEYMNPLYSRIYVRLDFWNATADSMKVGLFGFQQRDGFIDLSYICVEGADAHFTLRHRNSTDIYWIDSAENLTVGETAMLEIARYDNRTSDGYFRMWKNGVEVSDIAQLNQNTTTGYEMTGMLVGSYVNHISGQSTAFANITIDGYKTANATIGGGDSLSTYTLSLALQNSTTSSMLNGTIQCGNHTLGYTDNDWINLTIVEGTEPKIGVPTSINGVPFLKFQYNGTDDALSEIYPTYWNMNCTITFRGQPYMDRPMPPLYGDTQVVALYGEEQEEEEEGTWDLDCGFECNNYTAAPDYHWNDTGKGWSGPNAPTMAYSSVTAHHGVNSSHVVMPNFGAGQNGYVYAIRNWGSPYKTEYWLRIYVNYTFVANQSTGDATPWVLALYYDLHTTSWHNYMCYAGFRNNTSGQLEWFFRYRNQTANYIITGNLTESPLNKWQCLEIHYNVSGTDGCAEFWINNTLMHGAYGMDTDVSARTIRYAYVGGATQNSYRPFELYIDCTKGNDTLSTNRIGMESEEGASNVTLTIYDPQNTTYTTGSIPVNMSASGGTVDSYWFNVWNVSASSWVYISNQTYTNATTISGYVNGSYTYHGYVNNTDANSDHKNVTFSVAIPANPYPSLTIVNPQNTTYTSGTIPVELSASGGTIDTYLYNCWNVSASAWIYSPNQTYTTPENMENFVNGSYRFHAWVNNTLGNWDTGNVTFTVAIPATPSVTLTINNPQNTTYTSGSIPVNLTVTGGTSPSATFNVWNISASAWVYGSNQSYSSPTTISGYVNGTYRFHGYGSNVEGSTDTKNVTFTVAIPPSSPTPVSLTITDPQNDTYTEGTIQVSLSASGGTVDQIWYNVWNVSASAWVYVSNQSYVAVHTISGYVNGSYTFHGYCNNTEAQTDHENVTFTIAIGSGSSQPSDVPGGGYYAVTFSVLLNGLPSDCVVNIDGVNHTVTGGILNLKMPSGTYTVTVYCDGETQRKEVAIYNDIAVGFDFVKRRSGGKVPFDFWVMAVGGIFLFCVVSLVYVKMKLGRKR